MIYRRFGYLQSRLLLDKQDDLRRLESALDRLDFKETKKNNDALMSRHDIESDACKDRRELMQKIETNFKEYCKTLSLPYL